MQQFRLNTFTRIRVSNKDKAELRKLGRKDYCLILKDGKFHFMEFDKQKDPLFAGNYGFVHKCYRAALLLKEIPESREELILEILKLRDTLKPTPFEKALSHDKES